MLSVEKPHWLILSPMCLAFPLGFPPVAGAQHKARQIDWQNCWNRAGTIGLCLQSGGIAGRAKWTRSFRTSFGGDVMEQQCLKELLAIDGMRRVRCDQRLFDDTVNVGRARKAKGFMTNHEYIAEAVDRRCFGE